MERQEFLLEARRLPDLDELADGDGKEGTVGAEFDGPDGVLEGNPMQDDAAVEIDEQTTSLFVDREEEGPVGGDSNPRHVLGVLAGERRSLRLHEVHNGDAVAHGRQELGVI